MSEEILKHNLLVLNQLARALVGDRFKRMAKDEMLSRFMSLQVDPALFVDLHLQVEREAIHLAEISLLALVTPDRMAREYEKTARRIQEGFQLVYGEENQIMKDFTQPLLISLRQSALRARVELFNPFLSVNVKGESPFHLAKSAFQNSEKLFKKLEGVLEADRRYNDELVKQTESLHRFLMKKQTDYELQKNREIWSEFMEGAFHVPAALP